jgi:hypothetical protein
MDESRVSELNAIADMLSAECNIPVSCRDELLGALGAAKEGYVAGRNHDTRHAQLRSGDTAKRIRTFVKFCYAAHEAYNKLDEETKNLLRCDDMLDEAAIVRLSAAGYYCDTMIPRGRHRPINSGLYLFAYHLVGFWGAHVSENSLYARFQDAEDQASPKPVMLREPVNPVSKFVVKAAKALIEEPVLGATLEAMINRVLAGPPRPRVLPDPPPL